MIYYWLADFFATSLAPEFAAMFPVCACGALADQVSQSTSTVMGNAVDLSAWVPWDLIGELLPIVICVVGCALTIRAIRIVVSGFTGGGGSAA